MTIDAAFTRFPSLTTNRLFLRQIQPKDAEALFETFSDQEVMKFYGYEPVSERPVHPTAYQQIRYKVTDRLTNYRHQIQRYSAGVRPPKYRI